MKKRSHLIVAYVVSSFLNQLDSKIHIAIHVKKIELTLRIKLRSDLKGVAACSHGNCALTGNLIRLRPRAADPRPGPRDGPEVQDF